MADIELVIKIPEDVYTRLFDNGIQDNEIAVDDVCEMARALRLGTPLPKGHGKLVDLDQMCEDYWDGNYMEIHFNDLDNIKTIIEADKAESEDKCKGCEYYLNPDYTRCHECKAESEEQE